MGAATTLMTVEEYEKIPNPPGGRYELHHGELAPMPFPMRRHIAAQREIERLLRLFSAEFEIFIEFPFRPLPDHELWGADVAAISRERYERIDPDGYLQGSPELVIEVLSPSNTASEIDDKEATCFQGGCLEFWVVDPKRATVRITRRAGTISRYNAAASIELKLFGSGTIAVARIFGL